jgi:SNF2 family DNA or RNA helicase
MSAGLTKKKKPLAGSKSVLKVRKPHGYQKRGVEWLVTHGGAGLFADPGCGKTAITLRAFLALKDAGVASRALVIAPLRVAHNVWPVEAGEWSGSEWARLAALKIRVLHGKKKDWEATQDADIYVINFDGLKWLLENGQYKRFRAMGIDTLIIDESSKLKHTRTKRFKMVKPILPTFARRWLLTGSPNPNGYMDLFGQAYCIDLGRSLGPYITHYRMKYFTPLDRNGWMWALRSGAEKEIQAALAPYIFRLDADDYLEMPELVDNIVRVDLPDAARSIYDELEDELITELTGGRVVTAVSNGVAHMKCAQVANGGLYHQRDDEHLPGLHRTWENLHTVKVEAVQEIVEELNGAPCMIVYDYEHDLDRLKLAFPNAPHIGGGVGTALSTSLIADWNANRISQLLVQPQTVSHGLNMQYGKAQHIIWHSLIYDYEIFDQLIRRLRRQGSAHKKIFNHMIVARNTVDEAKLRALRRKERTQTGFLAALKEYAKLRKKA